MKTATVNGCLRSPDTEAWQPQEEVTTETAINRVLALMKYIALCPSVMSDDGDDYEWPAGPIDRSGPVDESQPMGPPYVSANFWTHSAGVSTGPLTAKQQKRIDAAWAIHRRTRMYRAARMLLKLKRLENKEAMRRGAGYGDHMGRSLSIRQAVAAPHNELRANLSRIAKGQAVDWDKVLA